MVTVGGGFDFWREEEEGCSSVSNERVQGGVRLEGLVGKARQGVGRSALSVVDTARSLMLLKILIGIEDGLCTLPVA